MPVHVGRCNARGLAARLNRIANCPRRLACRNSPALTASPRPPRSPCPPRAASARPRAPPTRRHRPRTARRARRRCSRACAAAASRAPAIRGGRSGSRSGAPAGSTAPPRRCAGALVVALRAGEVELPDALPPQRLAALAPWREPRIVGRRDRPRRARGAPARPTAPAPRRRRRAAPAAARWRCRHGRCGRPASAAGRARRRTPGSARAALATLVAAAPWQPAQLRPLAAEPRPQRLAFAAPTACAGFCVSSRCSACSAGLMSSKPERRGSGCRRRRALHVAAAPQPASAHAARARSSSDRRAWRRRPRAHVTSSCTRLALREAAVAFPGEDERAAALGAQREREVRIGGDRRVQLGGEHQRAVERQSKRVTMSRGTQRPSAPGR